MTPFQMLAFPCGLIRGGECSYPARHAQRSLLPNVCAKRDCLDAIHMCAHHVLLRSCAFHGVTRICRSSVLSALAAMGIIVVVTGSFTDEKGQLTLPACEFMRRAVGTCRCCLLALV